MGYGSAFFTYLYFMEELIKSLNNILSALQVQRANLQASHWNIKGCHSFITFHNYFGELYDYNTGHIDVIAEHIRALGATPSFTLSKYVAKSYVTEISLEESSNVEKAINKALEDNNVILPLLHKLFQNSGPTPDINDCVATLIADYNKRNWFLSSSQKQEKKEEVKEEIKEEEQ